MESTREIFMEYFTRGTLMANHWFTNTSWRTPSPHSSGVMHFSDFTGFVFFWGRRVSDCALRPESDASSNYYHKSPAQGVRYYICHEFERTCDVQDQYHCAAIRLPFSYLLTDIRQSSKVQGRSGFLEQLKECLQVWQWHARGGRENSFKTQTVYSEIANYYTK
jgi:hypothetical protein